MQIVFSAIFFAAITSVFCGPGSALLMDFNENSASPSLSDSDSTASGLPVSATSSFSKADDDNDDDEDDDDTTVSPTASTDIESCDDPPCNVIVLDDHVDRTGVAKSVNEAFGDRVVNWVVVAKNTRIDRTEEISDDFLTGRKKKVSSENRFEQLQVLRDSRHAFQGNEFDLLSVFK